jgi:hypothetical protein
MSEEYQHISGFGGANIPDWDVGLNADRAGKALGNAPGQRAAVLKEQGPRFDPILVLDASGLPGGIYFIK